MQPHSLFVLLGAASGFVGVAAGAFGAHALKARLEPRLLEVFETGARYQLIHAVLLVAVGVLAASRPSPAILTAGWSLIAGTLLFSGSLYALALSGVRALGSITPVGGVAFLVGWAAVAVAGWQAR